MPDGVQLLLERQRGDIECETRIKIRNILWIDQPKNVEEFVLVLNLVTEILRQDDGRVDIRFQAVRSLHGLVRNNARNPEHHKSSSSGFRCNMGELVDHWRGCIRIANIIAIGR